MLLLQHAIVRPMDIGEGLQWLLFLEPKGSHTEGGRNESSIFYLWVASSRGTLILLLDSLRSAIWKIHTGKCPRITRPMPIELTSGTALVRGQCLTDTSANFWQQIRAQNSMHWGAGRERYHGAVSWSPAPNPQLSRKPPAEHTILGLRLESIGRDARTTSVSHRYLCTLSPDTSAPVRDPVFVKKTSGTPGFFMYRRGCTHPPIHLCALNPRIHECKNKIILNGWRA